MLRSVRAPLGAMAALLALSFVSTARAAPPSPSPDFGARGQVAIDDILGLRARGFTYLDGGTLGQEASYGYSGLFGYSHGADSSTTSAAKSAVDALWLNPSFDVFAWRHVSLGVSIAFRYQRQETQDSAMLPDGSYESYGSSIVPRVGYVIPLGERLALWPRIGFGVEHSRTVIEGFGTTPSGGQESSLFGGGDLGLVFSITRHVYLDAAPEIGFAVSRGHYDWGDLDRGATVHVGANMSLGVVLGP